MYCCMALLLGRVVDMPSALVKVTECVVLGTKLSNVIVYLLVGG